MPLRSPLLTLAATAALLLACEGRITSQFTDAEPAPADGEGDAYQPGDLSNQDVFTRLTPTCAGCHSLDQRPYFASLEAFENLIAYDPRWVTPGVPAQSELLRLLEGTGAGMKQMPPLPSAPFAQLDAERKTQITMAELRTWIEQLTARQTPPTPPDFPIVRRKTAEMVEATLKQQLGLADADFYDTTSWDPLHSDSYAVRSPDATPYANAFEQGGTLFMAMGGPHRLEGKVRNDQPSNSFLQALVPISQAWCRTAFQKTDNTAVWIAATPSDASTTAGGATAIRANIAALYLKMLGQEPAAGEVDDLYQSVFLPYELNGNVTAWTAVCAALVRDPLWILY